MFAASVCATDASTTQLPPVDVADQDPLAGDVEGDELEAARRRTRSNTTPPIPFVASVAVISTCEFDCRPSTPKSAMLVESWRPTARSTRSGRAPAVHVPLVAPVNGPAPPVKLVCESSVSCGGSTCTTKLSHEPRELSEPAPTKPLFSADRLAVQRSAARTCGVNACCPFDRHRHASCR